MKLLRNIGYVGLSLASIVGALVVFEVLPIERFERILWVKVTLLICFVISAIVTIFGFIYEYYQIRKGRRDRSE
ncbi:MAG TPA: hypothetical protein VK615_11855 [Candidatus Binatia bacterium]|nr:hypothetical protein [Candidatus Binatia bacterium]